MQFGSLEWERAEALEVLRSMGEADPPEENIQFMVRSLAWADEFLLGVFAKSGRLQ